MKKLYKVLLAISFILAGASNAFGAQAQFHATQSWDYSFVLPEVTVREGVKANINVTVYVNEQSLFCFLFGQSLFAVQGIGHTAASWEYMAEEVFDTQSGGEIYCRVYAIDLPGQGESSLPEGMLFGDMQVSDIVSVYRNVWQRLWSFHVRPKAVVGHSRGALVVQLMQHQLLSEGSNLRKRFGVRNALLLGATPPGAIEWSAATPELIGQISTFITYSPELGTYAEAPPEAWIGLSYTNFSGVPHPATPIADLPRLTDRGPLAALMELFEIPPFIRPSVDPGIFSIEHGTRLRMVAFSQDFFGIIPEQKAIYEYLTGDSGFTGLGIVENEFAIHNLHIADPASVIDAIPFP